MGQFTRGYTILYLKSLKNDLSDLSCLSCFCAGHHGSIFHSWNTAGSTSAERRFWTSLLGCHSTHPEARDLWDGKCWKIHGKIRGIWTGSCDIYIYITIYIYMTISIYRYMIWMSPIGSRQLAQTPRKINRPERNRHVFVQWEGDIQAAARQLRRSNAVPV